MTDHIEELRKRGMITSLAKVPGAKTDSIEVLRGLVAKWREHAALYECELEQDTAGTLDRCADELDAALAAMGAPQQPAAAMGEEIMVNAAHGVYTLPLQPSWLLSGPRFVVHVPGPEQQPAAPSGAVNVVGMPEFDGLMDHIYEYGTTAEGVVERANTFARAVLARYAPQQPEECLQKAVAWARPVYAKPVGAPEAVEGEMVDVEFHLRAERPEGEGWRPLVFAAPFPPAQTQHLD